MGQPRYLDYVERLYLGVLERLRNLNSADVGLVNDAFELARHAHSDQTRDSGHAFILHPIGTVFNLLDLFPGKVPSYAIAAAFLHDAVEDSSTGIYEIAEICGEKVAGIVDVLTKRQGMTDVEFFWRIAFAGKKDPLVLAIRLADRLDNVRSLNILPMDRQQRIATETKDMYVPIAYYCGFDRLAAGLETELANLHDGLNGIYLPNSNRTHSAQN